MNSYPKIYALGHAAISELLFDDVVVQEKVDGSQFSFGVLDGELQFKSRKCNLHIEDDTNMFYDGMAAITEIKDRLHPGWTYRGEYLRRPKHNAITYDRIPKRCVIIFDINPGLEHYLLPHEVRAECEEICLEYVPTFYQGKINSFDVLKELLGATSELGGSKVEGIVIKNYNRFGKDKKVLMGKWVREEFKEAIRHNPGGPEKSMDILMQIATKYKTEARWEKAIQHLKEEGKLLNEPKDIGPLIAEVKRDIIEEEGEMIKEELFKWAKKKILPYVTGGLPEWYKEQLAHRQFDEFTKDKE